MHKYFTITILFVCSLTQTILYSMEKKRNSIQEIKSPISLDNLVKSQFNIFRNMTTKTQITFDGSQIRCPARLQETWQNVIEKTEVFGIANKLDNVMFAQIDITIASNILKKYYKPQIRSKLLKQIQREKITGYSVIGQEPQNEPKKSYFYPILCCVTFFSAGWFGKTLWDAGGVNYTITMGSYINRLIAELNF